MTTMGSQSVFKSIGVAYKRRNAAGRNGCGGIYILCVVVHGGGQQIAAGTQHHFRTDRIFDANMNRFQTIEMLTYHVIPQKTMNNYYLVYSTLKTLTENVCV